MKTSLKPLLAAMLLTSACGPRAPQQPQPPQDAEAPSAPVAPSEQPAPAANATLPEPNGPIDPRSVEAAGQVVQSYGALIEQGRWEQANALWGDAASAAKFRGSLQDTASVHLEIGNLGEPEGAAGSIYVTMPVIFYGDASDGQPFRRSADVVLRRVNDVPGSTEAQRRWHIERIDWAG
jgi:hypothetical protein